MSHHSVLRITSPHLLHLSILYDEQLQVISHRCESLSASTLFCFPLFFTRYEETAFSLASTPRASTMSRTSPTSSDGQRERRHERADADQTSTQQLSYLTAISRSTSPYVSPYAPLPQNQTQLHSVPVLRSQRGASPASSIRSSSASVARSYAQSTYSSSSRDDVIYDLPGPRNYTFDMPVPDRALSHVSHLSFLHAPPTSPRV